MTQPGGSLDAEFLEPAYATTACPECAVAVPFADLAAHLLASHGLDEAP
jgi:hypothetical protein